MKPLPLLDGAFLSDNSGIEKLRCPRMYEYSEIERRSPVADRAGANFGSTIHRGLETRYNLVGIDSVPESTNTAIESAMHEWLQEHPQPEQDFRDFNHACKMMRVYNRIYGKEMFEILKTPSGKPIIEATFALPLDTIDNIPIIYTGKIDLGIKDHNGVWSFDHKTTFQFGDTFDAQMSMDGGQLGYCWALGQTLGVKPQGYIIDAIRVRRPKKRDEFGGVDCIDATDFKRTPFPVTDDMLAEWREDTLSLIKNIFDYNKAGKFPRHRWQCTNKFGICEYFEVCNTRRDQREIILQSGLFEENSWSAGLKTNK